MTSELLCVALTYACFLTGLFRAPWVAFALVPPVLATSAWLLGLIDISSASHPVRVVAPLLCALCAGYAAWVSFRGWRGLKFMHRNWTATVTAARLAGAPHLVAGMSPDKLPSPESALRSLVASVLVFASCGPDLLALLFWELPGTWALVPIQIAVCTTILAVLFAPERWIRWATT